MPSSIPQSLPVTEKIAQFVYALDHDSLPGEITAQMKVTLVDFFRAGCAGLRMPWAEKVQETFSSLGGTPSASVLYSDRRIDPVRAAYINGVIAGSLDWDDTHVGAMLHPGVVVWPAVLAISEEVGASGKEMMVAAAAGYETMIRIGLGVQPAHFRRGFQSTATCGVFGSAAAAAKLLKLDSAGIRDALGLAASYAGGVTQFFLSGSEVKRLHAGKASAAGVEAALLAKAGVTGPHDVLEGIQGFGNAMGDGLDDAVVLKDLGTVFHLLGLQLKPHAVSARVLAGVEAAETLINSGAHVDEIASIKIGIPRVILGRLTLNDVRTLQQAQMSVPFSVALALVLMEENPPPLVLSIDEIARRIDDQKVQSLARRAECIVDPEIDEGLTSEYCASRVTLNLKDGRTMTETVMFPKGSSKRPFTMDEVSDRFRSIVAPVVGAEAVNTWLEVAQNLDKLSGAGELMSLRAA